MVLFFVRERERERERESIVGKVGAMCKSATISKKIIKKMLYIATSIILGDNIPYLMVDKYSLQSSI